MEQIATSVWSQPARTYKGEMRKVNRPAKFGKQFMRPILSGNVPKDQALWHLSLVLMEIAEKQGTGAEKTVPQHRVDAVAKTASHFRVK